MRIAILADRLPDQPWSHGRLAALMAGQLALRGHEVHVLCDSVENPAAMPGVTVNARKPYSYRGHSSPRTLAIHLTTALAHLQPEVTLSLSRLAMGDIWLPLAPSSRAHLGRVARRLGPRGPLCLGTTFFDLKRLPGDLLTAFAESRRLNDDHLVQRVLTFGTDAAQAAKLALPRLADRVAALSLPGTIARPSTAELAALRKQTRTLLRIAPDRIVVLLSQTEGVDKHLLPLMTAASQLHAGHRGKGPLLLMASNDAASTHRAAVISRATSALRIVSPTTRFDALLATADLVAIPTPMHHSVWWGASPSRLIADAMIFSRPVLALCGAPGESFLRLSPAPGLVVKTPTSLDWYVALQTAMDPTWRVNAGIAARAVADVHAFSLASLIDQLEFHLAKCAVRNAPFRSPTPPQPSAGPSAPRTQPAKPKADAPARGL